MNRLWKIIIFALLTLIVFVGCQKDSDNMNIEEEINPKKPYRSGDAIKNGDIVNLHGKVENIKRFESFLANVEAKDKDQIRITSYTIEGDPIFDTLDFSGEEISYTYDNSQDAFAGSDKGEQSTICSKIEKEKTDDGVIYRLSGCSSEVGNAFYFHVME
ncbi:MAG TPA: DUF4362 domain-containing protein [Bacillales bacterium]|nr:DUF4362 domain-containing protein [Bacillales bacterium]